jgi:glycosyltransferase involved in cell wall biosynthesis
MPTLTEIKLTKRVPGLKAWSSRLERRSFPELLDAPRIQGRVGEWVRMAKRVTLDGAISSEALAYEANDWLMNTMARECTRSSVSAVHSYEDCSLLQFEKAKKLGKACIYDMPIGYYPAWEDTENKLARQFADWLPSNGLSSKRSVRRDQKRCEMELADLVLAPSSFVADTISRFHDKRIARAGYGVDSDFWRPSEPTGSDRPLRFIYVGHISIRKGTPILLQAWEKSTLKDAELILIGPWQLAHKIKSRLPKGVRHISPLSSAELRTQYQSSDVFVFPSFFEGFGFVLLEAMACGLPVIASECTAAPDIVDANTGTVVPAGDVDAWVEAIRSVAEHRDELPVMKLAARDAALQQTWSHYRKAVSDAVAAFL